MASRESNIKLFMLGPNFMVNYILKIFKSISVECMERLNEDAKKKVTNCTRMFATLTVGNISFSVDY